MDASLILVAIVVLVALSFDFINGFHDAANSIATIVATRVLTPQQAVLWAATFNFLAVFVVGTGVAKTVGSGMIDLQYVTPYVIPGGLIGAISWDLITWWFGFAHQFFPRAHRRLCRGRDVASRASSWFRSLLRSPHPRCVAQNDGFHFPCADDRDGNCVSPDGCGVLDVPQHVASKDGSVLSENAIGVVGVAELFSRR